MMCCKNLLIFKILLILILNLKISYERYSLVMYDVWYFACIIFERFHAGVWWCFVWMLYLTKSLVKYGNLCAYHIRGGVWWCFVWMAELLCAASLSVTVADQQMNGCAWSTTKYSFNQPLLPLCLLSDRYPMSSNYFHNPKQARLALEHSFNKPFANCTFHFFCRPTQF